jgi:hypothetical protein
LALMAKPEQIQPLTRSKNVCMGLFGNPGVGKTRLIGSGGKGTLIVRPPTEHTDSINVPGAEEWVTADWDGMTDVQEHCRLEGKIWDWVWLDSASLFQDHGLDDIWADVVAEKPAREKHGLDKGEYGTNMRRLAQWVRHMVGMQTFNFGFTAHPEPMVLPDGRELLMPYIQGKQMSNKLCGYMNIVAYMEIKQSKRVLRTRETEEYYAKDQFEAFKDGKMVEPTMPKIMKAIETARASRMSARTSTTTTTKRRTRRRPTK